MRQKLKKKIKKIYEEHYLNNKNKFYFPILEKTYYSLFLDDQEFIKALYFKRFNKTLNVSQPKSFTEKIQWLKLYDRSDLHTLCADKLAVRDYISKTIGSEYLIPLIFNTKTSDDITKEIIPNYPVIIKPNHDSGTYFIIKNKYEHDFKKIRKTLKESLKKNYYFLWREWQYKNITPEIIVEKLLQQKNGKIPYDYKFHCSYGELLFIQVDLDKETNHKRNLYDHEWNLLPFEFTYPNGKKTKKPDNLNKMIELAKKISNEFIFARIDFYEVDKKVFFGEITFHPGAGFVKFTPCEWDLKIGEKIILPNSNVKINKS